MAPPPAPRSPSRLLGRAAIMVLAGLGGVVGLFGGLQVTRVLAWGPLHVSVGAIAAFVANAGFGALGAWGLRSRDAALAPGVGWFLVTLGLLFLPHPGGDIVVPQSGGDAIAFLVLGFAGIGLAGYLASRIVPRPASPRGPARR